MAQGSETLLPVIKSSSIVQSNALNNHTMFLKLDSGQDLNNPPEGWLRMQQKWEPYCERYIWKKRTAFPSSSIRMAHIWIKLLSNVDVVSNAENIKTLLKMPFSDNSLSMIVHRVGKTILIDEFDFHKYLLRQQKEDCAWLRRFRDEVVMREANSRKAMVLYKPDKTRVEMQSKNMLSKFLYHSSAQDQGIDIPQDDMHHDFARVLKWNFEDITMLLGTDMPIFSSGAHPCVSLRLWDMSKPINVLTGLDYWLDNLMSNVPELAMCYHLSGIVQKYEVIKTEEIPNLENCKFTVDEVKDFAQNILSFLKSNATKEGHTYWLFKDKDGDVVKLYDLTCLCVDNETDENPFARSIAALLYRMASNMMHSGQCASRASEIYRLLTNCLRLIIPDTQPGLYAATLYLLSTLHMQSSTEHRDMKLPVEPELEIDMTFLEEKKRPLLPIKHYPEPRSVSAKDCLVSNVTLDELNSPFASNSSMFSQIAGSSNPDTALAIPARTSSRNDLSKEFFNFPIEKRCTEALKYITQALVSIFASVSNLRDKPKDFASTSAVLPSSSASNQNLSSMSKQESETLSIVCQQDTGSIRQRSSSIRLPSSVVSPNASEHRKAKARAKHKQKGRRFSESDAPYGLSTTRFPDPVLANNKVIGKLPASGFDNLLLLSSLLYKAACVHLCLAEIAQEKQSIELMLHNAKQGLLALELYHKYAPQNSPIPSNQINEISSNLLCIAGDSRMFTIKKGVNPSLSKPMASGSHDDNVKEDSAVGQELESLFKNQLPNFSLTWVFAPLKSTATTAALTNVLEVYSLVNELLEESCNEELHENILRRLGNVHNELGSQLMNEFIMQLEASENDENDKELHDLLTSSEAHLSKALSSFQKVGDVVNLALVRCNQGRFFRVKTQLLDLVNEGFSSQHRDLYEKATAEYEAALSIAQKSRDHQLTECVLWELASVRFAAGTSLQDYPPLASISTTEVLLEKEVTDYLHKSLTFCEKITSSQRLPMAQYRIATIHHRLASLYHNSFRIQQNNAKRQKYLNSLAHKHYGVAFNKFSALESSREMLRVILERSALGEIATQDMPYSKARISILRFSLTVLVSSVSALELLLKSTADSSHGDNESANESLPKSEHDFLVETFKLLGILRKAFKDTLLELIKTGSNVKKSVCSKQMLDTQKGLFKMWLQETEPDGFTNVSLIQLCKHLIALIAQTKNALAIDNLPD